MSDSGIQFRTDAFRGDMAKTEAQYLQQQGAGAVQGFQQGVQAVGGVQQIQQQAMRARMDQALHEYTIQEYQERHQMFGMEMQARANAAQLQLTEMATERARLEHEEWLRQKQKTDSKRDELSIPAYEGSDGKIWIADPANGGVVEADESNPLHSIQIQQLMDQKGMQSAKIQALNNQGVPRPQRSDSPSQLLNSLSMVREDLRTEIEVLENAKQDFAPQMERVKQVDGLMAKILGSMSGGSSGSSLEQEATDVAAEELDESEMTPFQISVRTVEDDVVRQVSKDGVDEAAARAVMRRMMTESRWRNVMSNPEGMRTLIELVKRETK